MNALAWVGVGLLGGLGSVLRFALGSAVQRRLGRRFPFGTLTVNIVGSFILGVLAGADVAGHALLLAGTATIGAFTTFSTWMVETQRLAEDGEPRLALANVVVPLAAGLGAAIAGWAIGMSYL